MGTNSKEMLGSTSHTRLKAHDHGNARKALIGQKVGTVQVRFTLGDEALKDQRKVCGWNVYMESYMASCGKGAWCLGICVRPNSKTWA